MLNVRDESKRAVLANEEIKNLVDNGFYDIDMILYIKMFHH